LCAHPGKLPPLRDEESTDMLPMVELVYSDSNVRLAGNLLTAEMGLPQPLLQCDLLEYSAIYQLPSMYLAFLLICKRICGSVSLKFLFANDSKFLQWDYRDIILPMKFSCLATMT
jgi:hypothetical protein